MKRLLITAILVLLSIGGQAMIAEMTINELVAASDLIVEAEVIEVKEIGNLPEGPAVVANLVKVSRTYLGITEPGSEVKIKTYASISGAVALEKGAKYILFLHKVQRHHEIVNGLQGSWMIMEDGNFGGMGSDFDAQSLEAAINGEIEDSFDPDVGELTL